MSDRAKAIITDISLIFMGVVIGSLLLGLTS